MKKITGPGLIAGIITWLGLMIYATIELYRDHLPPISDPCSIIDFLLFAIIGLGGLAPSWIVADLFSATWSILLGKEEK